MTTVKALINHPMETGMRKNKKTGKLIPAHYIKELSFEHNGKTKIDAHWGTAVSKNPYVSFRFKGGNKGDEIKLSWKDNKGNTDSSVGKIK